MCSIEAVSLDKVIEFSNRLRRHEFMSTHTLMNFQDEWEGAGSMPLYHSRKLQYINNSVDASTPFQMTFCTIVKSQVRV